MEASNPGGLQSRTRTVMSVLFSLVGSLANTGTPLDDEAGICDLLQKCNLEF